MVWPGGCPSLVLLLAQNLPQGGSTFRCALTRHALQSAVVHGKAVQKHICVRHANQMT